MKANKLINIGAIKTPMLHPKKIKEVNNLVLIPLAITSIWLNRNGKTQATGILDINNPMTSKTKDLSPIATNKLAIILISTAK